MSYMGNGVQTNIVIGVTAPKVVGISSVRPCVASDTEISVEGGLLYLRDNDEEPLEESWRVEGEKWKERLPDHNLAADSNNEYNSWDTGMNSLANDFST
jgi:hypothetical protein